MKQIISFKKDIQFNTKIGEITSISLEHNLKMVEPDHATGEFIISGDYKITDVSVNREPFSYSLPFDIALDTKYNIDKAKVDIDDFYYEIINNQILSVNIDVLIDGIEVLNEFNIEKGSDVMRDNSVDIKKIDNDVDDFEYIEEDNSFVEDEIVEVLDSDERSDNLDDEEREVLDLFKEIETPAIDIAIESKPEMKIEAKEMIVTDEKIKSLFDSFDDSTETFTTYRVHIVRESDTIETIVTKYNTTKEEIAAYNKIEELKLGDKIVIPANIDE